MTDLSKTYKDENIGAWIELMKTRLDRYEVERNEYTADFKMPPRNVMFYRDVMLPFAENTLIMDNIAAGEGLRYNDCGCENSLRIRCFINDEEVNVKYPDLSRYKANNCCNKGEEISYPDNFPYLVKAKNGGDLESAFNNKEINNDIEICLPSEHAFYSILENVIRNSAKHNKEAFENRNLEIYISIHDAGDDLYKIDIYDNVSARPVNVISNILYGKRQSLLDESGQTRQENLGIADMKINAHLLRSAKDINDEDLNKHLEIILLHGYEVDGQGNGNCICKKDAIFSLKDISGKTKEQDKDIIDFIEVNQINSQPPRTKNEEEKCYRFGYRFHLAKSKKVCWIGEVEGYEEYLKKKGIYHFKDWKDFAGQLDGALAAYQFAILEKGVLSKWNTQVPNEEKNKLKDEDELEEILLRLPFRVLYNCTEETEGILDEFFQHRRIKKVENKISIEAAKKVDNDGTDGSASTDFTILKACWENWLRRWIGDECAQLLLCFEGDHNDWKKLMPNEKCERSLSKQMSLKLLSTGGAKNDVHINSKHVILFDHHGDGLEQIKGDFPFEKGFYQIIEKSSEDFVPIFYPPADNERKILFCFELIEAGLANIMVVDERLCRTMFETPTSVNATNVTSALKTDCLGMLAARGKLWLANKFEGEEIVPDKSKATMSNHFACSISESESHLKYKNFITGDHPPSIDGVIIHRTYLGKDHIKMKNTEKNDTDKVDDLQSYLKKLRKKIPLVIVISGGGFPHGMNAKFKFKPYNAYQRFFSPSFSMYNIVRTSFT